MTESLKPIEPGCLAYVLNASKRKDLIGTIVEVICPSFDHPQQDSLPETVWLIDVPSTMPRGRVGLRESFLMRIDPDEEIKSEEQECLTEKS